MALLPPLSLVRATSQGRGRGVLRRGHHGSVVTTTTPTFIRTLTSRVETPPTFHCCGLFKIKIYIDGSDVLPECIKSGHTNESDSTLGFFLFLPPSSFPPFLLVLSLPPLLPRGRRSRPCLNRPRRESVADLPQLQVVSTPPWTNRRVVRQRTDPGNSSRESGVH